MIRDTFAVRNMSGDLNDNKSGFEHLYNHTANDSKAEHATNHSTAKAHPKNHKDVAKVEPPLNSKQQTGKQASFKTYDGNK